MANNRMYVSCRICNPKNDYSVPDSWVCIAKYYPSEGWYIKENAEIRLGSWLERHNHDNEEFHIVPQIEMSDCAPNQV